MSSLHPVRESILVGHDLGGADTLAVKADHSPWPGHYMIGFDRFGADSSHDFVAVTQSAEGAVQVGIATA